MIEEGSLNILYAFASMISIGLASFGISFLMIDRKPAKQVAPNRAARRQRLKR